MNEKITCKNCYWGMTISIPKVKERVCIYKYSYNDLGCKNKRKKVVEEILGTLGEFNEG